MPNKWITHVKKYHSEHPNILYKQAMKDAKASYKKTQKGKGGCMSSTAAVAPVVTDLDDGPRHLNREDRMTIFEPPPRHTDTRRQSLHASGLTNSTAITTVAVAARAPVQTHDARFKTLLTKSGLF